MRLARSAYLLFLMIILTAVLCACGASAVDPDDDLGPSFEPSIDDVYEMACEAGYEGTLEELVALFKGAQGAPGAAGVGITSATINSDGNLLITLSDGSVIDCGTVVKNGEDGVGIASAEVDASGKLIVTLTDGSVIDCGTVVKNGTDGVGVSDVTLSEEGHLLVTLTDGRVIDCGEVPGAIEDEPADVTVTFSCEGEALDPITVKCGSYITLPTPVRDGYVFEGWYYRPDEDGVNAAKVTNLTPITQDMTLTALWHGHSDLYGGVYGGADGLCDGCRASICEHRYSEEWCCDASGHFYEYECGCQLLPIVIKHVDDRGGISGGADGKCDECGYALCSHSYSGEWSHDDIYHWHVADCGCDIEKADESVHRDADDDGLCDACAIEVMWEKTDLAIGSTPLIVEETEIPMVFELVADASAVYTIEFYGLVADVYGSRGGIVSEEDGFMTVAMLAGDSILFALTAETSGDYEIFVDAMLPETISEGEQTVRFYDADSASAGRCFLLSATENGIYGLTAAEGLSVYTHPRSELVEDKECVTLSAGMELLVFVSASEAGEYSLSIEYPRAEISGLVAEIAVSLAVNYAYYQYTFTASLDGTYTFHLPAGMGFHSDRAMSEWQSEEIKCEENTDGATVTFEIAEGEVFSFSLFAVSVGEYTVSVSLG